MSPKIIKSYTLDAPSIRVLELLADMESCSKSESVRTMIKSQAVAKADQIVEKFFEKLPSQNDSDWMAVKNSAGDLLQKRASLLHPELTPGEALLKVAYAPDDVTNALYKVQAINSQEHFAHYKNLMRSVGK